VLASENRINQRLNFFEAVCLSALPYCSDLKNLKTIGRQTPSRLSHRKRLTVVGQGLNEASAKDVLALPFNFPKPDLISRTIFSQIFVNVEYNAHVQILIFTQRIYLISVLELSPSYSQLSLSPGRTAILNNRVVPRIY
jgi:hypothetical protein